MPIPLLIRVLFLKEDRLDVLAYQQSLQNSPWGQFEFHHATSLAVAALEPDRAFDVVIINLDETSEHLAEDFVAIRASTQGAPLIALTSVEDDVAGKLALQAGADEYLAKSCLTPSSLARTLRQTLQRSRAEAQLRARERRLATAQRLAHLGSWEWDLLSNELSWSEELYRICGQNPRQLLLQYESWVGQAMPDATGRSVSLPGELHPFAAEQEIIRPDGSTRIVRTLAEVVSDEDGRPIRLIGVCQDVSEQKRSEEEKLQLVAEVGAQRRSLAEMVRNVPGVVWEWWNLPGSPVRKPTFVSDYAEKMFGYPLQIWRDNPDFGTAIATPEERPRIEQEFRQVLVTGTGIVRYHALHNDGQTILVEAHCAVVRNEQGQPIGIRGVTMDISGREAAEVALARSEETLRTIVENSRDVIYRFNLPTGTFDYVSPAVRSIGYAPEDLLNRGLKQSTALAHPDDLPHLEKSLEHLLSGDDASSNVIEYRIRAKTGGYRWVSDSRKLLRDAAGTPVAIVGNLRDISEEKKAEAALENANRHLVETSRRAGMAEVASNVLHNIGNVLNSVNVSVDLLTQTLRNSKTSNLARISTLLQEHQRDLADFLANTPQGRELPEYLRDLAEYLSTERDAMLQDLGALTRNVDHVKEVIAMQQNHSRRGMVVETVPLCEVLEDALRINANALQRHHVTIIREYQEVPRLTMEKHQLLQVLVNLISNARQALEGVRSERTLTLRIAPQDQQTVVVTVTDNAIGISAEHMPRIFEHGFTTRKEGHGFGLHSAALAADDLGGSLRAFSEGPGKGATFTLTLPIRPAADPTSRPLPDLFERAPLSLS